MALEDLCEDIIKKAQRGLRISDRKLCEDAGIGDEALLRVLSGNVDEEVIGKIGPVLGLDVGALIISNRRGWEPRGVEVRGVRRYVTNFKDFTVNAYLVWDPGTLKGIIVDTGMDAGEIIGDVRRMGIEVEMLLLTHSHGDHIHALNEIREAFPGIRVVIHEKELFEDVEGIREGTKFELGDLKIVARKTSGHSVGGLSYFITGLEKPVIMVGDALFAGSIGGVMDGYRNALEEIRKEILGLPRETVICPGHGPMTTVGEEVECNPFFGSL